MKKYKKEWSLGNGQCPDCHGCKPGFRADIVGHELNCQLAELMKIAGLSPVYAHKNEGYDPSDGFYNRSDWDPGHGRGK